MAAAESRELESARQAVMGSLGRVLGVDAADIRDDTPLVLLGWDALARLCLVDLLTESGISLNIPPGTSLVTVGDLAGAVR